MPQSRRHDTGPKQGPGDDNQDGHRGGLEKGHQAPPPPRRHSPRLSQHFSALLPQTGARRPRDDTTDLHQSTEPVPPAGGGPAPKRGPRTRSGAAIFYNCPMEAACVARGRSGFRLEPILRG